MGQNHFWFQPRADLIEWLWKTTKPTPGKIVADIGIGLGDWPNKLHNQGHRVIAIDRDKSGLDNMRGFAENCLLIQADATNIPLADRCLEAATLFDVLEHLADDRRALKEINRVLKPDGWLLISVPAFAFLWGHRDQQAGHYRRYERHQLERLLREHGFQIYDRQYYLCWLFPLFVLSRFLSRHQHDTLALENHPPAWLNRLLYTLIRLEVRLGHYIRWPFGSSLFLVARKQ